jgi:hypothetical protein
MVTLCHTYWVCHHLPHPSIACKPPSLYQATSSPLIMVTNTLPTWDWGRISPRQVSSPAPPVPFKVFKKIQMVDDTGKVDIIMFLLKQCNLKTRSKPHKQNN